MSELPQLDISVVTHNSSEWIHGFLESLINQIYPARQISLFVRDNGSVDQTLSLLEQLKSTHGHRFAAFETESGTNIGFGRGHNLNLRKGSAPFWLVTNVDLVFEPNAILNAITRARGDDSDVAAWEFRQKPYEHPKHYNPVSLEVRWASNACVIFRRSAVEQVGGYEERIFLYGEDVELSYRLRDSGYRLRYCTSAVCWHYSYESPGQVKSAQFFGSTLANAYIRFRYGSWLQALAVIPMYLSLCLLPHRVPQQWKGLLGNGWRLIKNAPYFLLTRKKSGVDFPLRLWDYDIRREGAFFEYKCPTRSYTPLVSVIIRTCQERLARLKEAVRSVLNQTYPKIELIIVEDGSREAEAYVAEVADSGILASVTYRTIEKAGRCKAGNVGLALANGEYLAFLDDDDLFYADHVEVLMQVLSEYPQIAGAYGLSFQVTTEIIDGAKWSYRERRFDLMYSEKFSRPRLWCYNYIPIQSVIFHRRLYEEYGGFDEKLDNLEDWNLWIRFTLRNEFVLVEKTTSLYRVPYGRRQAIERQKKLDEHYLLGLSQLDGLVFELSPTEVVRYAEELSKCFYVFTIKRSTLKRFILSCAFMQPFYHVARRIGRRLR